MNILQPDLHSIPSDLQIPAYFEAHCTNEYHDGPQFARVLIDKRLVDTLLKLQALCKSHDLTQVAANAAPEAWGPGNIETEARLVGHELVVTQNYFWFSADRKHADSSFETHLEDIDLFVRKFSEATPGVPLFFGDDEDRHEGAKAWQVELGLNEPPCIAVSG